MGIDQMWDVPTVDFMRWWQHFDGGDYPPEFALPAWNAGAVVLSPAAPDDEDLHEIFRVLTRPIVMLRVRGINAAADHSDTRHHLRMLAAHRGGQYAYMIRQSYDGQSVGMCRCDIDSMVDMAVHEIPSAKRAGIRPQRKRLPLTSRRTSDGREHWQLQADESDQESALAAFMPGREVGWCGEVVVQAGSIAAGVRPETIQVFYRDVVNEGRYMVGVDPECPAISVDDRIFGNNLRVMIRIVQRRVQENLEYDGW